MCCNNNLCNYDNNIENITEINKRSNFREDVLKSDKALKKNAKTGKIEEDNYNDIDVLTDEKKKKQPIHAFSGSEDIK